MRDAIRQMLRSKKAIATVAGLIASVTARIGLGLPAEDAQALAEIILALAAVYVASQGLADHGKHRPPASGPGVTIGMPGASGKATAAGSALVVETGPDVRHPKGGAS